MCGWGDAHHLIKTRFGRLRLVLAAAFPRTSFMLLGHGKCNKLCAEILSHVKLWLEFGFSLRCGLVSKDHYDTQRQAKQGAQSSLLIRSCASSGDIKRETACNTCVVVINDAAAVLQFMYLILRRWL